MTQKSEDVSRFINECSKYPEFWNVIEFIVVAIKDKNRDWINLVTKIKFHADIKRFSGKLFEVENLVVLCELLDFDDFNILLKNLSDGKIGICDINILYKELRKEFGYRSKDFVSQFDNYWKVMYLYRYGKSISELIPSEKELNSALHYDGRYNDVYEVIKNFTGFKGRPASIEIIAPIYLRTEGKIEDDKLVVECKTRKSIKPSDLELSWGLEKNDKKFDSGRQKFYQKEIFSENEHFHKFKKSVEVLDATDVRWYLHFKSEEIERGGEKIFRVKQGEINPRLIAHKLFDENFNLLKKWLNGEVKNQSRRFECAVYMLFHMCGFTTEWLGYMGKGLSKGEIDVLAFMPDCKGLIATECMVSEGKIHEKIPKLYKRTKELKERLKIKIIPAIFTCLEGSKIPKNLKSDIKNNKIALVALEEIKKIYEMAIAGKSPEEVFDYFYHELIGQPRVI